MLSFTYIAPVPKAHGHVGWPLITATCVKELCTRGKAGPECWLQHGAGSIQIKDFERL
jgi:hypothetical protein